MGRSISIPGLFYEDQKPAVDVGKSVSRVGGKTQAPVLKSLSETLRLEYAQFLELEVFTRFGAMVDERTRKVNRAWTAHPRGARAAAICPAPARRASRASRGAERRRARWRTARSRGGVSQRSPLWLADHCPEIRAIDDRTEALPKALRARLMASLRALAGSLALPGQAQGAARP